MVAEPTANVDVAIVGGGPAGCSAGVFTARAGLETIVFDRGPSSIRRCAYLENYPGFPGGIDIETFSVLLHAHVEAAGGAIVPDLVESIDPADEGFVVDPQEGDPVTARRVIAATRYDGSYMRGLDDEEELFATTIRGGETEEYFDPSYASHDGTRPVDGLYVASPSEADVQAITAAGRGARVAKRVVADARLEGDWWADVATGVDWMRRQSDRGDGRTDRDDLIEWFDDYYGADAPVRRDSERYQRVRDAVVEERLASTISDDEIESRTETGRSVLAAKLGPETVDTGDAAAIAVDAIGARPLLEAIDDEDVREYCEEIGTGERHADERNVRSRNQ
ncbi:NAD(P)/FAD-dependent oxidoreductase [Halosolutus amylolyticus]|uniref:NAD(P)/FAD-dependent oxidoreductase n=1 Tax=Halosolutus amylolyticus TaxID=2932267 RepID=A0ABD5PMR4_9EURY|nr:FAD-dependent monooxygenase [Halosolutus amylolyticus]